MLKKNNKEWQKTNKNLLIPAPVQSVLWKGALDSRVAKMLSQLVVFPVV